MNVYARFFRGVLAFKTVAAARESVQKLDRLYEYFQRLNDHAGMHHSMMLALTGMNRARFMKKLNEADEFYVWLFTKSMTP